MSRTGSFSNASQRSGRVGTMAKLTFKDVQHAQKLAFALGLTVTTYNSGTRRHEANGFRVFRGVIERANHFDQGWITHCESLDTLIAFLNGWSAARMQTAVEETA